MPSIFNNINTAVRDLRLKHSEFRVFMVLVSYNTNGKIFPSLNTISNDSGIKSISDISKMLHKLENLGYIKIHRRKHQSNIYEIVNYVSDAKKHRFRVDKTEDKNANIPDCLNNYNFNKAWEKWEVHLKEMDKKLTPMSKKEQYKFLSEQPDPVKVIELSIQNGYKRLFEIKQLNYHGNTIRRNKQQDYFAKETF